MMEEVARPVQAAQLSHCMNAEMLAADPPVIWSIPSGTALAMNAPRNQQLGISMINSCIASSVVFDTGILSSNIEMMEAMTDKIHSTLRQQLMSLQGFIYKGGQGGSFSLKQPSFPPKKISLPH